MALSYHESREGAFGAVEEIRALGQRAVALRADARRPGAMADFVDERTTALLEAHFVTRFQSGKGGAARARSMGDVWLKSGGLFNPINVKTGVAGANGQPNLVSLKKLLRALLNDHIDSYYLLLVKFRLTVPVACAVYFVDMLEWRQVKPKSKQNQWFGLAE